MDAGSTLPDRTPGLTRLVGQFSLDQDKWRGFTARPLLWPVKTGALIFNSLNVIITDGRGRNKTFSRKTAPQLIAQMRQFDHGCRGLRNWFSLIWGVKSFLLLMPLRTWLRVTAQTSRPSTCRRFIIKKTKLSRSYWSVCAVCGSFCVLCTCVCSIVTSLHQCERIFIHEVFSLLLPTVRCETCRHLLRKLPDHHHHPVEAQRERRPGV